MLPPPPIRCKAPVYNRGASSMCCTPRRRMRIRSHPSCDRHFFIIVEVFLVAITLLLLPFELPQLPQSLEFALLRISRHAVQDAGQDAPRKGQKDE
mmetsp:Transcript_71758/g.168023  ORF Transcript_71758/g.168023 Transcript_71758/m.168023 type:complete len:96 (-) Transcript_71758:2304-2591(-)